MAAVVIYDVLSHGGKVVLACGPGADDIYGRVAREPFGRPTMKMKKSATSSPRNFNLAGVKWSR